MSSGGLQSLARGADQTLTGEAAVAAQSQALCAHCGKPTPAPERASSAEPVFCCDGCATVARLLTASGLDDLTCRLSDDARPVSPSGRTYAELDTPEYHAAHVRTLNDGSLETTLYLGDAHCAACVWLVEAVPRLHPGALETRLDLVRRLTNVRWDPGQTSLSAIARVIDTLGYGVRPAKAGRDADVRRAEDRRLLVRIAVAGATAGNVMLFAFALYSGALGEMNAAHEGYFRWASLLVGVPGTLWPALVFFRGALGSLRARRIHMDLPVAVAIAVGLLSGVVNTVRGSGEIYFDSLATLTFLLLAGRWATNRRAREAADAAARLLSLTPSQARRLRSMPADGPLDGAALSAGTTGSTATEAATEDVLADALAPGDIVRVHAGEVIPCDGVVINGTSAIDNAILTGESVPLDVGPASEVNAGTTNLARVLEVQVSRAGAETRMGRLMADVESMAARKAPMVLLADRWAARFVVSVLVAAAIAGVVWTVLAGPESAVEHVVALLVVTCPCALGLATPLAVNIAIGRAARAGLLIRGGDVLEASSLTRGASGRIFLDKTGTLTTGALRLTAHESSAGVDALVAEAEATTTHPIGKALVAALPAPVAAVGLVVTTTVGGGLRATLPDGRELVIGSPRFVGHIASIAPLLERLAAHGNTPVVARVGDEVGVYGLMDDVRPEAAAVLARLAARGWRPGILSGDDPRVVAAVAQRLGLVLTECRGALSPEDKAQAVERARREGPVIMVGDGVNDAAALAAATVGLAVHGGAEASLLAADAFSARPGLAPLEALVLGADRTRAAIVRNLRLSSLYNAVGGTIAALGFMSPLLAAVLMPLSSLSVIASSMRARTFQDLGRAKQGPATGDPS